MKLLLTIESGLLSGRVFELESGFMTIGRGESCTVRFAPVSERIASKQHAFIEAKPDGFYITDNSSTNGTIVNGSRVQTVKLNSGDTVQFGRNGVIARIEVASAGANDLASTPTAFREQQIKEFETIAESMPENLSVSVSNIGLGHIQVKPDAGSSAGKNIAIGITIFGIVFLSLIVIGIMLLSVGPVPAVIAAVVASSAMFYILPLIPNLTVTILSRYGCLHWHLPGEHSLRSLFLLL